MTKFELQPSEKIVGMSVPDEDAADWVKTLTEAGFKNEEIDRIMSHLNATYKDKIKKSEIEKEFMKIKADTAERHGHILTPEEEKRIRAGIESRFK